MFDLLKLPSALYLRRAPRSRAPRVRQIRPDFDGPIIFLTARVAEEDAVAGYGLGARRPRAPRAAAGASAALHAR